jgi:hypothetical protein
MTTIYKQDTSHPNWTGRVSRQSRIQGEWSVQRQLAEDIPFVAWAVGIGMLVALVLAAFV